VLKFNQDGAKKLSDPTHLNGTYSFLAPYFERFRDREANAYVLNGLVVPPCAEAVTDTDFSVGIHVDNTVGIDSARLYMAHSVSVLYLDVPVDMVLGPYKIFFHFEAFVHESIIL